MRVFCTYPPSKEFIHELLKDQHTTSHDPESAVIHGRAITAALDPFLTTVYQDMTRKFRGTVYLAIKDMFVEHYCIKVAFAKDFKPVEFLKSLTALRCIHDRCYYIHTALQALMKTRRLTTPDGEVTFDSAKGKLSLGRLFLRGKLIMSLYAFIFVGLRIHVSTL